MIMILRIDDDRRAQSSFPDSDRDFWIIHFTDRFDNTVDQILVGHLTDRLDNLVDQILVGLRGGRRRRDDTRLSEFCPASPAFQMVDEDLVPLLC